VAPVIIHEASESKVTSPTLSKQNNSFTWINIAVPIYRFVDRYQCFGDKQASPRPSNSQKSTLCMIEQSQEQTKISFRKHLSKMKELYDRVMCINLLASNKSE
jgi:hypothetical protein